MTPPSVVKEAGQILPGAGRRLANVARKDHAGKNARDGFVAEHMEITAYQLLERAARFAGDEATVNVAQRIRAEEEAMAATIAASWDKVALESLRQDRVDVPAQSGLLRQPHPAVAQRRRQRLIDHRRSTRPRCLR